MVDLNARWFALLAAALVFVASQPTAWSAELDKNNSEAADNDSEQAKKRPVSRSAKQADSKNKQARRAPEKELDKKLEQSVLQMVNDYLPEVKILLDKLRDKEPEQYEAAVRGLVKASRRLQIAEKRGDVSLSLEVEVIKAVSAVNVLVAKLRIMDNPKDRKALERATERARKSELEQAKHEFALAHERLKRMQHQVDAAKTRLTEQESKLDEQIKASFQANLRRAGLRK